MDAAKDLLKEIQNASPFTATVLKVASGKAYIDKGYGDGIQEGEELVAFREKEAVKDLNGQVIAVITEEVGRVRILEVDAKYSVCKILSGNGQIQRHVKVKRRA